MRPLWSTCLVSPAIVLTFLVPPAAHAGANADAKIALHLKAHTYKAMSVCSTAAPKTVPCSEFQTKGRALGAYDAYLIVANAAQNGSGIGGLSCGVYYDGELGSGVDVYGWTLCADVEATQEAILGDDRSEWPYPGSGIRITWNTPIHCQKGLITGHETEGIHAIAGAFYLYAYGADLLYLTPNMRGPAAPELAVVGCDGTVDNLPYDRDGAVRFSSAGNELGYNPCTGAGSSPPDLPPDPPPLPPPPDPPPPLDPAVILHIGPAVGARLACESAPTLPSGVVTSAAASPDGNAFYYVYVLGAPLLEYGGFGISGMQFGIEYTSSPLPNVGLKVLSWSTCGDLTEFRGDDWPASGTGNTLVWGTANCQVIPITVAGYFYVGAYSAATMSVVGWPGTGVVKIANCNGAEVAFGDALSPSHVGWIALSGGAKGQDRDGCNPALEPCNDEGVSVTPTTWGQLKRRYGQ
jgi:hypothetical protein